jgi:peptidyl-prolyl cis-trans isomerase C
MRNNLTAVAGLFLLLAGCKAEPLVDLVPPQVPPDKTVVTINGEPLSLEEFDNEFRLMQIHYSAVTEGDMRAIKRRLFEQVINRHLLVQEARRAGLKLTQTEVGEAFQGPWVDLPENARTGILKAQGISEEVWKRKMLQERLARKIVDLEVNSQVRITPSEAEDYYWTHLSNYWRPQAVRARHLIVQRKADLLKVLDSLKRGEDFPKIIATFSVGPEKSRGGDMGFMDRDRLSTEYLKTLSALHPGEISKPLKDDFGYHLFQLVGWRDRQMRPFPEVVDSIRDDLLKDEQDLRFDQWMSELKKKSMIKVNKDLAPVIGVTLEDLRDE